MHEPIGDSVLLVSASRVRSRPPRGVIAVIASGLIVTLVVGLWRAGLTDFAVWTAASEWQSLEQRSMVHAADGTVLAVLHDEVDRRVVELEEVPAHVRQAVLVAEDRRFYDHAGYDSRAVARAFLANVRAGEVRQGGSTITQQLAKQNFVGSETSLRRKIKELAYALMLERSHSKDELLERYLNQVYFGAGAYGIAVAAEEFFRVEPDQLTVPQAAMLAGMIRAPGRLDPRRWPDAAKRRRDHVLASMAANGDVHPRELAGLQTTSIDPSPPLVQAPRQRHLVEAVKREFLANPAFGATMAERIDLLFSGGLHIFTTLDPRLQQIAERVMTGMFPAGKGPTGALAAVEPGSGRILALHSGTDFATEQFDVTTQGRRQPGSAFKPFVFAAALERGVPVGVQLAGSTTAFRIPGHVDPWSVTNYGGADYGTLTLHEALVRSVNTAFAQLVLTVGPDAVADLAQRAGIDMQAATAGDVVPAIALGGFTRGVTPLEMASAYGVFAAGGTRAAPHLIDRVVAPGNTIIHEHVVNAEQAVASAVAAATVGVMQDVVRHGTGQRAQVAGWAPAGKTGTTQLHTDAWFIGFVPGLSAAVWMGHPEGQIPMGWMVGGNLPAQAWSRFISEALAGVEPVPFPPGDGPLPASDPSRFVSVPQVADPPPPPREPEPQPAPTPTVQPNLPRVPPPRATPTPAPIPTPEPTLTPNPTPSPMPTPTPEPTLTPTPTPSSTFTPARGPAPS